MSQDFGGNKYSKNIRVTIHVRLLCHKTLERILTAIITSDNTNKIIVSQDFGGNKCSKNSKIIYIINEQL